MSISNAIHECVQILISAQIDKTLNTDVRFELANVLVRLKIWAGNVGVFAPDNASLDHRLRENPDLVEVVFSMTKKLQQSLHNAAHPPLLEESDDEDNEAIQGIEGVSTCSDSSSGSLDLDSSVEESDSDKDLQRLGPSATFVQEANNVINRLYRLVTIFRNPGSSSENAKIRGFIRKLRERGELEELEDVKDHALSHIKAHFPQTPSFLVTRLVEAVVFRRMKIRYRQRHQAKLQQGLAPAFAFPAQYDEEIKTPNADLEVSRHISAKSDSIRDRARAHSTSRSVAFSSTNASSINRARMADYARSTALSEITEAAVGRRQQLDVPPPPTSDRQDKVECPYCLRIISQEEMVEPRWTRHILKDIDPLVCLFENCEESLKLFNTVEEWLGHMRWQHTIIYSCQAVGHERELFDSPQDLEGHIRGQHTDTFTESQVPGLIRQGTLPAPNTLGALNASLSVKESCCVLCNNFDPQTREGETTQDAELRSSAEQTLQNHIIEHLEVIALIALPSSGDADGEDPLSSESHQNSGDSGTTSASRARDPLLKTTYSIGPEVSPQKDSISSNFQAFMDFHTWADENQVSGTDALGNDAKYIPFDALQVYWQNNRVSRILGSGTRHMPITVSIDNLLQKYLRIFSILVQISTTQSTKVDYIKRFMEEDIDDNLMPFKSKPVAFSNAVDGVQTFELFQKKQWLFCPVIIGPGRLHSRELPLRCVLPFTIEKIISGKTGKSSTVKKCKLNPSCGLSITTIILKEFDISETEFPFKNEVDSYLSLESKVPSTVYEQLFLGYYGSFKKGEKAFIMFEHANQGSLLDFFERNELPRERNELCGLWWSLINLLLGLEHIHSLKHDPRNSRYSTVSCVHRDLRPGNIFVFKQGNPTDYRYQFKIGGFEMSSVALVKTMNKTVRSPGKQSTEMYGAPELTYRYADLEDIDYDALWEIDIWSFGCVLFECLVWMTCGSRGLSDFFQMRQNETDGDLRHKSPGYSGCFHNGTTRVQAVKDMMELVMKRRRLFDDLSGPIGDLILKNMLIPSSSRRLNARTLLPRFEKILEAKPRPTEHLEIFNSDSGIAPILEGRPSQEDIGDKADQVNDQAIYSTGSHTLSYGLQNLESTDPRMPNSTTGSRRSHHGSTKSHSSNEARDTQESFGSPTSMEPVSKEQAQTSTSLPHMPHLVSHSPIQIGLDASTAASDLENESYRTSVYNIQPAGEPRLSHDRMSGRNPLGSVGKGYALVRIPEVLQWIESKKKGLAPEPLPDHDRAMWATNGRGQIFVVDDSSTMRKYHWKQVIKAVKALGYLVKHAELDGVDLFFTSSSTKPEKSGIRESTTLVRSLEEHERTPAGGPCNMESSLGPILEHVKSRVTKVSRFRQQKKCRGINVYILTDAIWEGGTGVQCGVEEPIKDLRRTMQALGKTRAAVFLQFIQFGDDTLGRERLRYLDEELGKQLDFDIVDHKHHQRDGVWHMLVGPISHNIDSV